MVNTDPPAMIPEVAPIASTFTFSSSVEARLFMNLAAKTENPTARMDIGIADSIPCPSFSAM